MRISFAHFSHPSTAGIPISFAVFDARSNSGLDQDNSELLEGLVVRARGLGLRVEKAALAFREGGQIKFWGTKDLVQLLAKGGLPRWTHYLDI